MSTPRVVVVGGGITGLAAAFTLQDEARAPGAPLALDRARGGAARRRPRPDRSRVDGFVIEAGPNGFLNREPQTLALDRGAGTRRRGWSRRDPRPAAASSCAAARLCQVPDAPATLLTSPALSWRGKLRLLGEPFAAPGRRHRRESVLRLRRRAGSAREAADMLVDAAVAGISAGDSRRLSVGAQFPRLVEMERTHGSLLRAMFAQAGRRRAARPVAAPQLRRRAGRADRALAARLGPALRHRIAAVRALERVATTAGSVPTDAGERRSPPITSSSPCRRVAPRRWSSRSTPRSARRSPRSSTPAWRSSRSATAPPTSPGRSTATATSSRGREGLATLGVVVGVVALPGPRARGHGAAAGHARRHRGGRTWSTRSTSEALRRGPRASWRPVLGIAADPGARRGLRAGRRRSPSTPRAPRSAARASARWRRASAGCALCGTSYDGVSFNDAVKSGRLTAQRVAAQAVGRARRAPRRRCGCGGGTSVSATTARGAGHLRRAADAGVHRPAGLLVAHPARPDAHRRGDPGAAACR